MGTITRVRRWAVAMVMAAVPAVTAAQTITFTHTATGFLTGSIAGNPFTADGFTITATGNVGSRVVLPGNGFAIAHTSARITVNGVGTYDFITATRTFVSNSTRTIGFGRASGLDLFNGPQELDEFASWDLTTSIGPLSGNGLLLQWNIGTVETSGGVLFFVGRATPSTFTAVVGNPNVVPEPSTYAMLATALPMMAVIARRRRRHAATVD